MSTNTTAIPPAASFNSYSQLYAGVSLKQLNMAVISTLAVLVIIIVFLTILRARRGFRFRTPLPVTHLRAVGSRGLFMDPRFNGSRSLDPALISTVGRSYAYDGLEADDSREREEAPTKDSEGHRVLLVGKECVVCLAEYRVGETLKMLHACGHSFHEVGEERRSQQKHVNTVNTMPCTSTKLPIQSSSAGSIAYLRHAEFLQLDRRTSVSYNLIGLRFSSAAVQSVRCIFYFLKKQCLHTWLVRPCAMALHLYLENTRG